MSAPSMNERAWAIDVILEINRWAGSRKCAIRSAGGEWSVADAAQNTTLFPDVLLFGDPSQKAVLQGWELKMPDTPVTDGAFIENAEKKARALGLGSFLLWNAREAVLYVAAYGSFSIAKAWCCEAISNRSDVTTNRDAWVKSLTDILDALNEFIAGGRLPRAQPLDRQTELVVAAMIRQLQGRVAEALKQQAVASGIWRAEVDAWWVDVSREHPTGENRWAVLSVDVLLHWIHRFMFAHYLKRFVADAYRVEKLTPAAQSSIEEAETIFADLSAKHDFAQLFKARAGSNIIPPDVWTELLYFNGFLRSVRTDVIEPTLLQSVINSVRQTAQRKALGQFCTPPPLAELLVRLSMDDMRAPVYDPCCGSGTIAKAALAFKMEYGITVSDGLATTWASDKHAMPLQFATLALASVEAHESTVKVFQQDLATLRTGDAIPFVDAITGRTFIEKLPAFPCIVLNPPFVRFEEWGKNNPAAKEIATYIDSTLNIRLSGKSDLFAPLVLHLWRLGAGENGRVGVIVSNSWLGTEWGVIFRKALLQLFHLEVVVASGNGRWFEDAKIVTNILVLRRKSKPGSPPPEGIVTFASTIQPIGEWTSKVITEMSAIINKPDSAGSLRVTVNRVSVKSLYEFDQLGLCWTAHFCDLSWLNRVESFLTPVASLFDVHRGERRGWDKMFFIPDEVEIEPCCIRPVLRSSSDASRLRAIPDGRAFCCPFTEDELKKRGHTKALRWIAQFAKVKNETGKPLPEVLARAGRKWYEMRPDTVADFAASMNYAQRLFVLRLTPRAFVNQRLIRFTGKTDKTVDLDLCHALLCSLMGAFYIESLGFGRGLGALDLNATKVAKQMRMLDPSQVPSAKRGSIVKAFDALLKRDILPFEEEVKRHDRIHFESCILDAYGLADLRPQIAETVLRLHTMRLSAVGGQNAEVTGSRV